jgi:hypothetical protein
MNDTLSSPSLPFSPTPAYKDRRGWLIAFGVLEILIACFFLFMVLFMVLVVPNMPKPPGQPQVPNAIFYAGATVYLVPAAIFAVGGVGSIRARNWARIFMIVVSCLWLAFGVLGTVLLAVVMPLIFHQQETMLQQNGALPAGQLPPNFETIMLVFLLVFQIVTMVLFPLMLLFFYTRKSVKATCQAFSAPASSALPAGPFPSAVTAPTAAPISGVPVLAPAGKGLPVPIIIAIICFLFYGVTKLAALWLPITLLFGVTLRGAAARLVVIAFAAVDLYCAWSFYKLRIQGWWVAIATFVLSMASGVTTLIRVDLRNFYDEVYRQMGMNPQQMGPYAFGFEPNVMHFFMAIGWLIWSAIFVFLIFTKRYFPEAHRPNDAMTR